jgi:hypothetical protein
VRGNIRRRDRRIILLAGDFYRFDSIVDLHNGIARVPCKLAYMF